MDLKNYLIKVIKKADGHSQDDILQVIKNEPSARFYVEASGFNKAFLNRCFNENNCRVAFSNDDSFDTESRLNFIDNCPVGRPKSDVFIYAREFDSDEVKKYLKRKCTVLIWNEDSGNISPFVIKSLANEFPDQVVVIAKGLTPFWVGNILNKPTPLTLVFRKDDYTKEEIQTFADKGQNRVAILAEGFTAEELTNFRNAGALIWPEVAGA